jgi:hypothetical protein
LQQVQKEAAVRKNASAKIASSQTLSIPSPVPDLTVSKNNPALSKTTVSSNLLTPNPSLAEGGTVKTNVPPAPGVLSDRAVEKLSANTLGADSLSGANLANLPGGRG